MSSNFTSKHSAEGQAGSKPVNTRHVSRREAIFATTQDETGGIKKASSTSWLCLSWIGITSRCWLRTCFSFSRP